MKPVVALDIDGVLNAINRAEVLGHGWEDHRVKIPARHLPASPFISGPGDRAMSLGLCLNPGLHGPWISKLTEIAEVVWATTWEHAANHSLAPLLGIEPLPVGISVRTHKPDRYQWKTSDSIGWKSQALEKAYDNRPLVWIDDLNKYHGQSLAERRGSQPTLIVTCDEEQGLTPEHMETVDSFLMGL